MRFVFKIKALLDSDRNSCINTALSFEIPSFGLGVCSLTRLKFSARLNFRIQGHSFTSHRITKVPMVLYFVLQKILAYVKQVVRCGSAFSNCSGTGMQTLKTQAFVAFSNRLFLALFCV